ncbi:MAG TPA: flap endonuclease-1 [Candidatus Diapherotrites archaeon]|uniref:Flap endonuclease 1 n=1 Tax=Candidatus Iainarchaeum sp. TaxID=3101447 RepID=A0A7J4JHA5_9ARCH|nr:flap endonuclease-1 [Candidatus Diapherotrites archaeon]HIH17078.1 flap endonuclease-1 [Candidatus Diapherotrites archaeon]
MGTAIGELLVREEISLDYLKGRRVGIDSHNILYQFLSSIRSYDGTPLMDSHGNVTSHLTGLLYRTVNLLEKDVKPVFVFDGVPSKLKKETLEERKRIRTEALARHEEALKAGDLEEARKMGARSVRLTPEMIAEAKKLIEALGLPLVQALDEGEAQIAGMVSRGTLFGCVSQDYDSLLFGASRVLRNIAVTGKRKMPGRNLFIDVSPELIELQKCLETLKIDRRKLVWIGLLIGTDFNEKFPNIGPKKALKLVQDNDSFEKIVEATGYTPGFDYREIEEIFLNPKFNEVPLPEFRKPDRERVKELLCEQHDFSLERVMNALDKLEKKTEEKGAQASLSKWF